MTYLVLAEDALDDQLVGVAAARWRQDLVLGRVEQLARTLVPRDLRPVKATHCFIYFFKDEPIYGNL